MRVIRRLPPPLTAEEKWLQLIAMEDQLPKNQTEPAQVKVQASGSEKQSGKATQFKEGSAKLNRSNPEHNDVLENGTASPKEERNGGEGTVGSEAAAGADRLEQITTTDVLVDLGNEGGSFASVGNSENIQDGDDAGDSIHDVAKDVADGEDSVAVEEDESEEQPQDRRLLRSMAAM